MEKNEDPKYCPLSFFSFFINKNASQAGGAMRCVGSQCAWWDEGISEEGVVIGQCGFMSLVDCAKNFTDFPVSLPMAKAENSREISKKMAMEQLNQEINDIKKTTGMEKPENMTDIFSRLRKIGKEENTAPPPPPLAPVIVPNIEMEGLNG